MATISAHGGARPRLGDVLRARGWVSEARLGEALAVQAETDARLGEVLVSRGWLAEGQLGAALAAQAGLATVALAPDGLDPALADPRDLGVLLRHRIAPFRRVAGRLSFVAADPALARLGLSSLTEPQTDAEIMLVDPRALDAAMLCAYGPALAARAASRCPEPDSARAPMPMAQRLGLVLLALLVLGGGIVAPAKTALVVLATLVLLNAMNALARLAVLGAALRPARDGSAPQGYDGPLAGLAGLAMHRPLPCISLLIPLLREPEVLPLLVEAVTALDWPHERLDVIVILEQGDQVTVEAAHALGLPPNWRVLVLPEGGPRTKPRALNLALDFARGDIVGIYDAEDRPEPDQLRRVAAILAESPPEVACVQCRLSYYNPRENWLTRCFTIEYAMWFDVLIAGFRDLRLPIPLGGTSVFFRRGALEALGGWDAHNVTEDADLGMRLARRGMRCEVSISTTHEEANSRLLPWVRQRSRWLKGYMTTWLVHMRRPQRLWHELGLAGFCGFHAVFLGAVVAYLGLPLFWVLWASVWFGIGPDWLAGMPVTLVWTVGIVQLAGWMAMVAAALIATGRRQQAWLMPWIPTLLVYWPIGTLAAYLALIELVVAPSHWRKTRHGVGREAARELARVRAAAQRRVGRQVGLR